MNRPRIAVVARDPEIRLAAARVFDAAPGEWSVALFASPPNDADVVVVGPDVNCEGIRLDLDAPSRTLELVSTELRARSSGRIIAVAGIGGGVGCTSVALHLAAFLPGAVYLETRPACGGRYRLGLDPGGPSWAGTSDEGTLMTRAIPLSGLRALLAPESGDVPSRELIDLCRATFSWVVVDAGTLEVEGLSEIEASFLVVSPTVPAMRRASAFLAEREDQQWTVISNRLGPGSEVPDATLDSILVRRVGVALPCSPLLRDAEDEGRLLGTHASVWSRRVANLATILQRG